MIGTKCPECNEGHIVARTPIGRTLRFKTIPDLELPAGVVIPTCDHCGEEYLDRRTAEAIDRALDERYRAVLLEKASAAIDRLKDVIPQRDLERLVGVSPGYLSKLRSGKETSASFVALLLLLAHDPSSRVAELREHWLANPSSAPVRVNPQSVVLRVQSVGPIGAALFGAENRGIAVQELPELRDLAA